MSERAEKLAIKFERGKEKTIAYFKSLSLEDWGVSVYSDGAAWTILEMFTHVVESERDLRRLMEDIAAGGEGVPEDFELQRFNESRVKKVENPEPKKLIEAFSERRDKTIAFVSELADEDLDKRGRHPTMGTTSVEEVGKMIYLHVQMHIRDARGVLEDKG
jgi:hypothetical protein